MELKEKLLEKKNLMECRKIYRMFREIFDVEIQSDSFNQSAVEVNVDGYIVGLCDDSTVYLEVRLGCKMCGNGKALPFKTAEEFLHIIETHDKDLCYFCRNQRDGSGIVAKIKALFGG